MTGRSMTNYDMDEIIRERDRDLNRDSDWIDSIKDNYPDLVVLEPRKLFNSCIVGIVERINLTCLCYDVDLIIFALMDDPDSSFKHTADAWEHYEFNIRGSFMGENSPVFLTFKKGDEHE